jgi:hypothetical protein
MRYYNKKRKVPPIDKVLNITYLALIYPIKIFNDSLFHNIAFIV